MRRRFAWIAVACASLFIASCGGASRGGGDGDAGGQVGDGGARMDGARPSDDGGSGAFDAGNLVDARGVGDGRVIGDDGGTGPCTPSVTCESASAHCGTVDDGCGHRLPCGTCTAPEVCGGDGRPNTCGRSVCTLAAGVGTELACAVRARGGVWCWGSLSRIGLALSFSPPIPVAGVEDAIAVTGGNTHVCAIRRDGRVACWGMNGSGQLGHAGVYSAAEGVLVDGLTGVTKLAAGQDHTCAIRSDGSLWCWGDNRLGQLGDGIAAGMPSSVAAGRVSLADVVDVAAQGSTTCAVTRAGDAYCWGGPLPNRPFLAAGERVPVHVEGVTGATAIAVSSQSACVLAAGRVSCFGENVSGTLGRSPTEIGTSYAPLEVPGLAGVVEIGAGLSHVCARASSGAVSCWGSNTYGEAGNPAPRTSTQIGPFEVLSGGTTALAVGYGSACVRLTDGTLQCWGHNAVPMVFGGMTYYTDGPTPTAIDGLCACTLPLTTCASSGRMCSAIDDGCGATLTCGSCTAPQTCGGGGTPFVCGCTPISCERSGRNCGHIDDGCGHDLDCGSCRNAGEVCGGRGIDNVCAVPCTEQCRAAGADCGMISGGCTCGTCTSPQTCGGSGHSNVCGCTPHTCERDAVGCGMADNGCGGTMDCGMCSGPYTCGGAGFSSSCGCRRTWGAGEPIATMVPLSASFRVVLDGTVPHVFWITPTTGELHHAVRSGGTWTSEVVAAVSSRHGGEDPAAAIDASGTAYVAYYDASHQLSLAVRARGAASWTVSAVDTTDGAGAAVGIALAGATVHLAYRVQGTSGVQYAVGVPGSFTHATVSADAAAEVAVAVEASGAVHVVYAREGGRSVRHAVRAPAAASFTVENVATTSSATYGRHLTALVDAASTVHTLWTQSFPAGSDHYRKRASDMSFSLVGPIPDGSPLVGLDALGGLHGAYPSGYMAMPNRERWASFAIGSGLGLFQAAAVEPSTGVVHIVSLESGVAGVSLLYRSAGCGS